MIKNLLAIIAIFLIFPTPAFAAGATLSLSPSTNTFNRGCNFKLDILLDTGGNQTDGTDVILKFDPTKFTVTSVTKGTIYGEYPAASYDNNAGSINISGIGAVDSSFAGNGKFATLNLSVNTNASLNSTQITFDFDPSNKAKTTDSNVVQTGTVSEVLNSVTNGTYNIGTGNCSGQGTLTTGTPTPVSSQSASPTLPPAGIGTPTMVLTVLGAILTIIGIAGLALL